MSQGDVKADIRKILLIRFSSLGDIVMATPLIRCVRQAYPDAKIDMIVRSDFLDLIRHNPHLDEKIGLPREKGIKGVRELTEQINHKSYDLIYDAHRSLRTLVMMPFLRAKYKAYYQKNYLARSLALTFKLPLLNNVPRMIEKYISPLNQFGVVWDGRGPEIFVDNKKASVAGTVGLIPSAQWPGKRWPTEYFKKLSEIFVEKTPWRLKVFGGPSDIFCKEIIQGLPKNRVEDLQGNISLLDAIRELSECEFVVANDTGLMHVADALGIPCVLMLGPTSKEMGCLPFHPKSHIVEKRMWCRPCSKNGQAPCIRGKRHCMLDIQPEEVWLQAQRLSIELGGHK